jgi:23S rRNA (guanosine2251-2'-O)-methyltransferase
MIYSEKEFIFGMHPVMEAIKGGRQIDRILIRQGLRGELYHELMKVVNEMSVPWQVVPVEKLDYITRKNHQGVIAWISAIEFQDIENLPSFQRNHRHASPLMLSKPRRERSAPSRSAG